MLRMAGLLQPPDTNPADRGTAEQSGVPVGGTGRASALFGGRIEVYAQCASSFPRRALCWVDAPDCCASGTAPDLGDASSRRRAKEVVAMDSHTVPASVVVVASQGVDDAGNPLHRVSVPFG